MGERKSKDSEATSEYELSARLESVVTTYPRQGMSSWPTTKLSPLKVIRELFRPSRMKWLPAHQDKSFGTLSFPEVGQ